MAHTVSIRYWAAARAAAGVDTDDIDADSIAEALAEARSRHGAELERVLSFSSLLVDGVPRRGDALGAPLSGPAQVEVLPPFAGG